MTEAPKMPLRVHRPPPKVLTDEEYKAALVKRPMLEADHRDIIFTRQMKHLRKVT